MQRHQRIRHSLPMPARIRASHASQHRSEKLHTVQLSGSSVQGGSPALLPRAPQQRQEHGHGAGHAGRPDRAQGRLHQGHAKQRHGIAAALRALRLEGGAGGGHDLVENLGAAAAAPRVGDLVPDDAHLRTPTHRAGREAAPPEVGQGGRLAAAESQQSGRGSERRWHRHQLLLRGLVAPHARACEKHCHRPAPRGAGSQRHAVEGGSQSHR
mmetsp:Transcript_129418/g.414822  ORF Transcript_129418/g.414822 Transcript_129418/m.414822 type:complete len:212 (+) Transcript_129418:2022-2657(+)